MSEMVIELDELEKTFGEQRVLRGLTFSVGVGEVFCLLGPNGSGKTTTLEIIQGFQRPTSGSISILGQDPHRQPTAVRNRVGVVLQESGFPKFLRVGEMIQTWRSYYDHPLPYDKIIDLVELRRDEGKLVRRLSGGQKRRLDFALALAGDPDVVLLDEPTTGFDPESRARCWAAIEGLRALGKTVLLTTHYLDEAERLADRIAILKDGRAKAVGTAPELARLAGGLTSVSVSVPPGPAARLARVPGLEYRDGVVLGSLADPREFLRELSAVTPELSEQELQSLAVVPPRLEDTYLALVGATEPDGDPQK